MVTAAVALGDLDACRTEAAGSAEAEVSSYRLIAILGSGNATEIGLQGHAVHQQAGVAS